MNFKKIILILFLCLFALGFNFVFAQEEPDMSRNIGAGKYSNCTLAEGESDIYHCMCQSNNEVLNCRVGWLNSDPICVCCGDCTLNNFLGMGVNIANLILKLCGVFALAFLIIGGLLWITSGGSPDQITKGKKMITGSIIGIIVILIAFTLIKVVFEVFDIDKSYLPKQSSIEISVQTGEKWPDCPIFPTIAQPWCYGCVWTGLNRGCQGTVVKVWQEKLNRLDCNCGTPDGLFGSQTKACVEKFQQANGLVKDGLVGPETYGFSNPTLCP